MSDNLGENFNQQELSDYLFGDLPSFSTDKYGENLFKINKENKEVIENNEKKESGQNESGESGNQTTTYKDPLSKIGGGGVLQYPIDLDTDLQDYFEIQIFKYRAAGSTPSITANNQGYTTDKDGNTIQPKSGGGLGGYFANSNRRGNRQNFRLQDLQSTIQLPIPPSVKDMNSVGFGGEKMSGFVSAIAGPAITQFLEGQNLTADQGTKLEEAFAAGGDLLKGIKDAIGGTFKEGKDMLTNKEFVRLQTLRSLAQFSSSRLGINIDIDQAITRTTGAVRNPNLELLFNGPSLRSFSFTIRFTPRDEDEAKRVRMIIRALKQHSVVKKNPNVLNQSGASNNFLLGTPDVFKLRYIKARTQKDIKGLNKFKTCALTDISVDYTGEVGRFAAYEVDSQPITSLISLSFTELAPIYDEDYAEFTADDDVGL